MGVASLVLGIISAIIGFVPFCGTFALIPAIIGLILGIVDWVKQSKAGNHKGKSIAGTILSAIAIVVIMFYWIAVGAAVGSAVKNTDWNSVISNSEYNITEWKINN